MIRRARRDGREARGNEEREKKEDEKGNHCFFKSSGYDKLELKHQNLVFSSGGEGEERGLRKGAERGYRDREKRDKRELS